MDAKTKRIEVGTIMTVVDFYGDKEYTFTFMARAKYDASDNYYYLVQVKGARKHKFQIVDISYGNRFETHGSVKTEAEAEVWWAKKVAMVSPLWIQNKILSKGN